MKHYKSMQKYESFNVLEAITCDKCKTKHTRPETLQHFNHIEVQNSKNGAILRLLADICQECMLEMIWDFAHSSIETINIKHESHDAENHSEFADQDRAR